MRRDVVCMGGCVWVCMGVYGCVCQRKHLHIHHQVDALLQRLAEMLEKKQ